MGETIVTKPGLEAILRALALARPDWREPLATVAVACGLMEPEPPPLVLVERERRLAETR